MFHCTYCIEATLFQCIVVKQQLEVRYFLSKNFTIMKNLTNFPSAHQVVNDLSSLSTDVLERHSPRGIT